MPKFHYPLSVAHLALFRDFFRQKYGSTLFYTSEQFIQSAFLEFQDAAGDDGSSNGGLNYVLDAVAMVEDCHCALHQQTIYTKQLKAAERPCTRCAQIGVLPTGVICPTCAGTGRRSKKTRA